MTSYIRNTIYLILLVNTIEPLQAVSKEGESILDRLERRLLEQEHDALSFGDRFGTNSKTPPKTKYKYQDRTIPEYAPSSHDLKKIDQAMTDLEAQVEYLANGVHSVKQKILQDAGINNFISISTKLENKETMSFRTLKVTIDGHTIYEQNAALGLWLPDPKIPLFRGPMQPGNHRIDFEATIVQKSKKVLPLETGTFHKVNESYKFKVPNGKIQRSWEIAIAKASSSSPMSQAKFKAVK